MTGWQICDGYPSWWCHWVHMFCNFFKQLYDIYTQYIVIIAEEFDAKNCPGSAESTLQSVYMLQCLIVFLSQARAQL